MAGPPLPDRLYRALLRLFPREFRGDFGDQMAEDFRDQRAEAATPAKAARLWTRTTIDALRQAPREHLDILLRDAGYALRLFRRRPAMTISALATLAIGIGLTAAVFSVAYGVLWQPLPLPDSERIVVVREVSPAPERQPSWVSPDNFLDWRRETRTIAPLVALSVTSVTLLHGDVAELVMAGRVTEGFFETLCVRPVLGRAFAAGDFDAVRAQIAAPKAPAIPALATVAVLSHDTWVRHFGGSPGVVGQRVDVGRLGPVEIVGVLGPDAVFPLFRNAGLWLPDVPEPGMRRARYLMVAGRLAPAVSVDAAQSELDTIAARLAAAHPEANADRGIAVTPLRKHVAAGAESSLWLLLAAAGCVLLIACANVSNLLLTHTAGRQGELATRAALGASRVHLVRQALTEGLVLAAAGGLAGLLLAAWATPALLSIAPDTTPRLAEVRISWPVVLFTMATAIAAGTFGALGAALAVGRSATWLALRRQRFMGDPTRPRVGAALITGQVALAVMLAVAAGLLVQTMRVVMAVPLGFDPTQTISIGFAPEGRMTPVAKAELERRLIDGIQALDGVIVAGIGSRPLTAGGMGGEFARLSAPEEGVAISVEPVGPGYLEALGARLVAGRPFTAADGPGADLVALVNQAAEARYFPEGALGQRILHNGRQLQIVGVAADLRRHGLEGEVQPALYLPSGQTPMFSANNLLVRVTGDPRALLPAIRTVARQADPRLPLTRIQTLPETLDVALAPRRFILWLVGLFSLIAIGLAVIGIYGVLAESVAQRVPEIGVRMALGATAAAVMRLFLRQGGSMVGIGVALGLAGAWALSGVMAAFVFGVPPTDPVSFAVAATAVVLAGLLACALPARRASRVDPVIALRQE